MRCFVIVPFGNPRVDADNARRLELIYSRWIKPTVEAIKFGDEPGGRITCHRADQTRQPGEVINHVIEKLTTAEIVIADLTGKNPNVFYELGVRHAVSNNTHPARRQSRRCAVRPPRPAHDRLIMVFRFV